VFNGYPHAQELLSIQIVDGIVSVAVVVKLAKAISTIFNKNIENFSIFIEKLLNVPFSNAIG